MTSENIGTTDWQELPTLGGGYTQSLVEEMAQGGHAGGHARGEYGWQELGQMYRLPPGESTSSQLIDILTNQLVLQSMGGVSSDPEYQQMALDLARQQADFAMSPEARRERDLSAELVDLQLDSIRQAREVGAITGDLSQQEIDALNQIESNAIQTLTEQVNKQAKEVMGGVVSQMVDRGVLQGDIGARAMAEVGKEATRLISEGVREFASQKAQTVIGMGEAQKNRQLELQQMVQAGALSREQANQVWASEASSQAGLRQELGMGFAQSAQQYASSLATQQWESAMGSALGRYGVQQRIAGYAPQGGNRAAIKAADSARKTALWGAGISAASNMASSWIQSS